MSAAGIATGLIVARRIRVRGVVQGVGFRPFVFRLAQTHQLAGWVLNGSDGVEIHAEGSAAAVEAFARDLRDSPPPAAAIASIDTSPAAATGPVGFAIRDSETATHPTARISPDLPVCRDCLAELFEAGNRRYGYPYINCTACGPRYSIIESLPYDRPATTMAAWTMCEACRREYADVSDRRFQAQPIACAACGPRVRLEPDQGRGLVDGDAIAAAAALLASGAIVAIKGIGGYHVACDAANATAVRTLRERKFRKERPFALMVRDLATARAAVHLSDQDEALLQSTARPIVITPALAEFDHVAPGNADLGVMLPYTPVHHLLFAAGAPAALVMTSGNRSSEPIAFEDDDARERLRGLADAILVGDRPIARRVDDSIQLMDAGGPIVTRRARGLAPGVVARIPASGAILAVGADLKNAPLLLVGGEALLATHLGDLEHHATRIAFERALVDLTGMYGIDADALHVAYDAHPDYASTAIARQWPAARHTAVQHHRAHVASVMAEHGELDTRVIGIALDGSGYGDDGTIWGGELFTGSVGSGFIRAGHLRPASLIGGDAAARNPVQAAAGFVSEVIGDVDLCAPPFFFPARYRQARQLASTGVRIFTTTSAGRLFDTVAALVGFTRPVTFEGQAAIWLEQLAGRHPSTAAYPVPFVDGMLDYRPSLAAIIGSRLRGDEPGVIARAFHHGLALGLADAAEVLAEIYGVTTAALSGGVFQNRLLTALVSDILTRRGLRVLINRVVPANDGGIALGQAALAAASLRSPTG